MRKIRAFTVAHEAIDKLWPVALLAMLITVPWLVAKSYKELKAK